MPVTRLNRSALRIEPRAVHAAQNDDSTNHSPVTPFLASPDSATSEGDNDGDGSTAGHRSKEKKKRSRVTPEQLVHLERYFTVDRSPTAARRREISELLGMQERQTQIWFQNRRAKAKMLNGRAKDSSASNTPPDLSSVKYDIDLHNIIHEDDTVTFIPCTDLSVGTWRRIATTANKHDLVAYVCETKQSLAWFILSGGNGFKMELPFDRIISTELRHVSPNGAHVVFTLSEPPLFYLEHPMAPRLDGKMKLSWRSCSDWTEGAQATKILRHELFGSAPQLSHLVQRLKLLRAEENISLISPSYKGNSISSPFEIPAPPMAGLLAPSPHYESGTSPGAIDLRPEGTRDSEQVHQTGYNFYAQDVSTTTQHRLLGRYSNMENPLYQPSPQLSVVPVSSLSTNRPYSATMEVLPTLYPEDVSIAHSLQGGRRHTWTTHVSNYAAPSPPLLTALFHPGTDFC